jgi:hypothetical protein
MSAPHEKLADSLRVLRQAQANGKKVFQSTEFSRTHRERLATSLISSEKPHDRRMVAGSAGEAPCSAANNA